MYRVFDRTYVEESDTYPTPPARALTLRPGETLRQRWTGKEWDEGVERRASSPLAAAALPRRPKPPALRPGYLAGPAAADGGFRYRWVAASLVPHRIREAVRSNVVMMRDALGLSFTPEVRYFRPCAPGEPADFEDLSILGKSSYVGQWVAVRADLDTREAAATARHEVAHMVHADEETCEAYARALP